MSVFGWNVLLAWLAFAGLILVVMGLLDLVVKAVKRRRNGA